MWGIPERELRRRRAATLYELEALFAEEGWPSEEFVYDDEHDLYRSRQPAHKEWKLLDFAPA